MIKTETRIIQRIGEDGKGKPVEVVEPVLDRRSGEPIVTEDRAPGPFRALPRANKDLALAFLESKAWYPVYQRYDNGMMVGLQCWKCGRELVGWAPALRRPPEWRPGDNDQLIHVNGQPAVKLTCFNHYREGLFRYRRADGVPSEFSYLHCADCSIADSDGENLLTCFLSGHDSTRTLFHLYTDDFWAQWMWRWSNIELDQRAGPSKGPGDLMQDASRKGGA